MSATIWPSLHRAGEIRHDRRIAFDARGIRHQDAVAQIGLIGGARAAAGEVHHVTVHAVQIGRVHRRARRMTARAAERMKQRRALMRQVVGFRLRRGPARIVLRRYDVDRAGHDGVVGAAEFRAGEMENAGLVGVEPFIGVAIRQNILLQAQRRQIEVMDHVLRCHRQPYVGESGHMQFVDFARAARMLEAPHPLLGDDMNFQRVFRRRGLQQFFRSRPPEDE